MKYYLAYGSNLNKEQMKHRCPDAEAVGHSVIEGYRLVFRRGYLTVEEAEGQHVPVGIWRITAADEKALDRYEGYPKFYRKETFPMRFEGSFRVDVPCLIYIMQDGYPIQQPSDSYFYTVYTGYKHFGITDREPLIAAYEEAKWGNEHEEG